MEETFQTFKEVNKLKQEFFKRKDKMLNIFGFLMKKKNIYTIIITFT